MFSPDFHTLFKNSRALFLFLSLTLVREINLYVSHPVDDYSAAGLLKKTLPEEGGVGLTQKPVSSVIPAAVGGSSLRMLGSQRV